MAYDTSGYGNPTRMVDPLGRTTILTYSNQIDLAAIAQVTVGGLQKNIAQYTYNSQHLPLTYVDAAGQVTLYTYNGAGQPTSTTDALGYKTQFHYDGAGDLVQIENPNGAIDLTYTYDSFHRVASMADSQGYTLNYTHDAADRITKVDYPDGTNEAYTYDKLDLIAMKGRDGGIWKYAYDVGRNLTSITSPDGVQAFFGHNGRGQMTSLTDFDGNTTNIAYDLQGRPTTTTYPDTSTATLAYENSTGRVKSRTDALSQVKQVTYALDDQISSIAYVSAVNATAGVSFTYDPYFGQIASTSDGTGTTQFAYGDVGKPGALQVKQVAGPLSSSAVNIAYDPLARPISRTIAGSVGGETFKYDNLGRLQQHASDLGTFDFAYLGQTTQLTQRALIGTTLKTAFNYLSNSGDRRLSGVNNTGLSASKFSNFQIDTDPSQQVMGITENSDAATVYPTAGTQTATYNNLNQLTNVSGQAITYDAVGNVTADGTRNYKWDAENRLIEITYPAQAGKKTAFTYDGASRRVAIASTPPGGGSTTTTSYIWCGAAPCQARNGASATIRQYLAEGEYVPGGTAQSLYYGVDQIGSVRRVFSSAGSTPTYAYDPYGVPLQGTAPLTDIGYAGMFYNTDSGLSLTQYRAYDPVVGRWLSRDPLGEFGPQNMNLHEYVLGDPLSNVDPTGLWFGIDDAIFSGGGALIGVISQGVEDFAQGKLSSWQDYTGSAIGGAAGGEAMLYLGPVASGVVGGAATNAAKQGLNIMTGATKCPFDWWSLGADAAVGGILGAIPGIPVNGLNRGRGSALQVFKQMVTKAKNGTAESIRTSTAIKMFHAQNWDTNYLKLSVALSAVTGGYNRFSGK
jgi:RHS repeat-associated protein